MHDLSRGWSPWRWLIARWDRSKFSMASSEITLEAVPSVSDIPAADWDACANPQSNSPALESLDTLAPAAAADSCAASRPSYNPFVSHAFFAAAEASSSACA